MTDEQRKQAGLIDNWKKVLLHAWSIRFMILAGILSAIEVVLPLYQDKFPRGPFAVLSFVATILAVIARLKAQKSFQDGGK